MLPLSRVYTCRNSAGVGKAKSLEGVALVSSSIPVHGTLSQPLESLQADGQMWSLPPVLFL